MRRSIGWLGVVSVLLAGAAWAGSLESPAAPTDPASARYTLEAIYDRLDTGAPGAPSVFTGPSAGPAKTGRTVAEIMAAAPAVHTNAATAADVASGKAFWGLSAGAWGLQVGTRIPVSVTVSLTVRSVNPGSGVPINISPPDLNADANGMTSLQRLYPSGDSVHASAPGTAPDGNVFERWLLNGVSYTTNFTASVLMTDNLLLESVYIAPPPPPPSGMVLIPGGTNAGTNPLADGESHDSAWYPETYRLTVDSFYMDATHITMAQWDEVYTWAITNEYSFDRVDSGKAANHPVHTVNWHDVVKWCNARSEMEGRPAVYTVNGAVYKTGQSNDVVQTSAAGYRLPTDTEWEYAARGGLSGRRFPWGDTITHSQANYYSSSSHSYDTSSTRGFHPTYNDGTGSYRSPVGSFAANGYGLYDMVGNVRNLIFDWYPGSEGSRRVVRGGGWYSYASYCRVGFRSRVGPGNAYSYLGFRAVLSPGQQ